MEQLNNVLPGSQEGNQNAAVTAPFEKPESPLLREVRSKFWIFGGISLIFGLVFTLLFFKAGIGLNIFLFTLATVTLLMITMKKLSLPIKKGTVLYYGAVLLLGVSSALTASEILLFINILGILLLLDLSLLNQFYENRNWSFLKHLLWMIGLGFQSIGSIGLPFIDGISSMKHTKVFKNDRTRNIFLGVFFSIPVLLMVTALLANADLLFGKLTGKVFRVLFSSDILVIAIMVIFGFLACYCILCGFMSKVGLQEKKAIGKADASIAITFMTLLTLVYAVFCVIQVVYLFANGLLVLPDGFTFAEYARRGFFELLAVAVINVALMVFCRELFQESKLLRLIITIMTVCTYIMIASATYRMLLYIGAYHLTFLRVFVLLSLLIISLVLAGVILSEYNQRFPLFKYCVAVVSVCYILFSLSKPDYFIAQYLIDHTEILNYEDLSYLTNNLSLDAAPAILPVLEDEHRWTLDKSETDDYRENVYVEDRTPENIISDYYQRISNASARTEIRDFNYSIYLADKYSGKYPLD